MKGIGYRQLPHGKFEAYINIAKDRYSLGCFGEEKDAANMADNARLHLSPFFKHPSLKYNDHPSCAGPVHSRVADLAKQLVLYGVPQYTHYAPPEDGAAEARHKLTDLRAALKHVEAALLSAERALEYVK